MGKKGEHMTDRRFTGRVLAAGLCAALCAARADAVRVTADTVVTDATRAAYAGASAIEIAAGATLAFDGLSADLTLSAPLSGGGTLVVRDTPTCILKADNSAFAGAFAFTNTAVYVDHAKALGTQENPVSFAGSGTSYNKRHLYVRASGVYTNPLTLGAAEPNGGEHHVRFQAAVTNLGPLTVRAYYRLHGDTFAAFGGRLDNLSGANLILNHNLAFFGDAPIDMGGKTFYDDTGTLRLSTTGLRNADRVIMAKGTLLFGGPNLFAPDQLFQMGCGYGPSCTLDLNGFDQQIGALNHFPYSADYPHSKGAQTIRSATPATLTIRGQITNAPVYEGLLEGAASLALDCSGAVLTLDGGVTGHGPATAVHTTTGTLAALHGTLTLGANTSFSTLSALAVSNDARLVVKTAAVNPMTLTVRIGDAGVLELDAGVTLTAQTATTPDGPLAPGSYTAADLPAHLAGAGTLVVRTSSPSAATDTFVWTGAAGSTAFSDPANWQGNAVPALTTGGDALVFTAGAAEARAPSGRVFSLAFRDAPSFTLAAAPGARLDLGLGGLSVAAPADGKATVAVAPGLHVADTPQTWTLGADTTLYLNGDLSSEDLPAAPAIAVDGSGTVVLAGDNARLRVPLAFSSTAQAVCHTDTALGAPSRAVTLSYVPRFKGARTNAVPLRLVSAQGQQLLEDTSSSLVQQGALTSIGWLSLYVPQNGRVTLEGGAALGGGGWWQAAAGAVFSIVGKPVTASLNDSLTFDNAGTFFVSATNTVGTLALNKSLLVCGAPDILANLVQLQMGGRDQYAFNHRFGRLDLNGFDQTVKKIFCAWSDGDSSPLNHAAVTSAVPATLTVTGDSPDAKQDLLFEGQAALHFAGTGVFPLTNALSTTSGELAVSSGTLRLDAGAGWTGATNVTVSGTGTLHVTAAAAPTAFKAPGVAGRDMATALSLRDDGALRLDAAVDVARLSLDGRPQRPGIYGGPGSGAANVLPRISGPGLLHVWRTDLGGTLLILR